MSSGSNLALHPFRAQPMPQIQAFAALERGASLTPYSFDSGPLAPHECLVQVLACGLCHSDIHCVDDDWKVSRYPLVPGHEVVGTVIALGSAVEHLEVGARVGVSWQCASCGRCRDCTRANENLCDDNRALIVDGHGGFADLVQVDARWAFPLPHALQTSLAGPILCAGVTVYASLRDAGMTSGQNIGVVGLGGLGHLAIQFASKLGNRVTAFTTSPDKADFARDLGAHESIVIGRDGAFPLPNPERKLAILLVTATADLDWAGALEHLDSHGALSIASVPDKPLLIPVMPLQNKSRRVTGSNVGSRVVIEETLRIAADYNIRPIVQTFAMHEVNHAMEQVRANKVRYRAVLLADSGAAST